MTLELIIIALLLAVLIQNAIYKSNIYTTAPSRKQAGGELLIDTSALMDGRIITVAKLGFLAYSIVIPRSVLLELQLLADKADADKRMRARAGLDAVRELQEVSGLTVTILPGEYHDGVDNHLLALARQRHAKLCTIDYNLNKVAQADGIEVINPNELAKNIRMSYLPGEQVSLEMIQKGQSAGQAVGYLADGTMVVVEKAEGKIGKTVKVEFIRALQTDAGRMMFAKLAGDAQSTATKKTHAPKQRGRAPRPSNHEDRLVELANRTD